MPGLSRKALNMLSMANGSGEIGIAGNTEPAECPIIQELLQAECIVKVGAFKSAAAKVSRKAGRQRHIFKVTPQGYAGLGADRSVRNAAARRKRKA